MQQIREATVEDIPALVVLGRDFHGVHPLGQLAPYDGPAVVAFLERCMTTSGSIVLVGEVAGRVAGLLVATLVPIYFNPAHLTACEICWYVGPEHRQETVGAALYEAFILWAHVM